MQMATTSSIQFRLSATALMLLLFGQFSGADDHAQTPRNELNAPPEGFTALFNGTDFAGWRVNPKVKEMWSIEDGVLKSRGLLEEWGADLVTEREYRDFILMLEFRMPTISDSGICFRRLIPEIPGFGSMEQFNLRSRGGMGHLESYYFLPHGIARRMGLKDEEEPTVQDIDPEVGVWHKVTLAMKGRTLSAEYDGEVLYDSFQFHDWMMNMEPAPVVLQKHVVVRGDNLGPENPCPIEYRNIFIKELGPSGATAAVPSQSQGEGQAEGGQTSRPMDSPNAELLARIDASDLPGGYEPTEHQQYVDQRMEALSDQQRGRISQLWKEKQRIDPEMPNRGYSFVKILAYVARGETLPAEGGKQPDPSMDNPTTPRGDDAPESRSSKPVNGWKWSAETDAEDGNRKAIPLEIPEGPTIYVVPFGLLVDENPPLVLLPDSRLTVTGRLATAQPVYFGITIKHPNGDSAGRFLTSRPADEFQDGEDFDVTLDVQEFQLDSSLAGIKDNLPSEPFHFVVESIWITTLENEAGLEIAAVELFPGTEETAKDKR